MIVHHSLYGTLITYSRCANACARLFSRRGLRVPWTRFLPESTREVSRSLLVLVQVQVPVPVLARARAPRTVAPRRLISASLVSGACRVHFVLQCRRRSLQLRRRPWR